MKVEINNSPCGLWGRLNISDADTAASLLSGSTFKTWVRLALNQDGFLWDGQLPASAVNELLQNGYLYRLDGGGYVFDSAGNAAESTKPDSWQRINELYGLDDDGRSYAYVSGRLNTLALSDKADEIYVYWAGQYKNLLELDHSKAKDILRYDFAIVLVWWIRDHFRFQSDDVLQIGPGGNRLRYHSDSVKMTVRNGALSRGVTSVKMTDKMAVCWNRWLSNGDLEIPLDDVGAILRNRKCQDGSSG